MTAKHHTYNPIRRVAATLVLLGSLGMCGCGMSLTEVTGSVSLDNEPLTSGRVTLFPEKFPGKNVGAQIQPDGTFFVPSVPNGPVRITVQPLPPNPRSKARAGRSQDLPPVPMRYTDPDTSDLVADIRGSSQQLDLELPRE